GDGPAAPRRGPRALGVRHRAHPPPGQNVPRPQDHRAPPPVPQARQVAYRIGRTDQLPQAHLRLGPHPARWQTRSCDLVRTRGIRPQPRQDRGPGQMTTAKADHGSRCSPGPPCANVSPGTFSGRSNYALQDLTEDAFVAAVTARRPPPPRYFALDARANRERHALPDEHAPDLLDLADVLARRAAGDILLDPREPADFAVAHLAGAVNIGLQGRFAEWAGSVLPPDRDIILVGDPALAAEAKIRLARVGLDRVAGQLTDASVFASRPELAERSSRL